MTQAIDQTIELEKRLLSALMLRDGEAVAEVADVLTANDFYRPEHKKIYSAILRLHAADVALNWLLVKDELLKSGDSNRSILESLDGLSELEYTTARAPYYAERIKTASQLRRLVEIGRELSYSASKGGATTIEVLADVEKKLTAVVDKDMRALTSAEDLATETFDEIMRPQAETAIQTKFRYVDKLTGGGLKKSDLIILAARPGMGKTTFAINIAANVAMNHSVLFFSLEMSRVQIGKRLFSAMSRVSAMRIQSATLTEGETRAITDAGKLISKLKLFVDDSRGIPLSMIRAKAQRLKREKGLDLIIIDYLQLIQCGNRYAGNRVQEVSELSRGLKILAQELDTPVLVLSQLSRAVEQRADKKPLLSDLRESGSIEQDADIVMFLYREDYYDRESDTDIAEVIIAKNRNGATGSVPLRFEKEYTLFSNLTKEVN